MVPGAAPDMREVASAGHALAAAVTLGLALAAPRRLPRPLVEGDDVGRLRLLLGAVAGLGEHEAPRQEGVGQGDQLTAALVADLELLGLRLDGLMDALARVAHERSPVGSEPGPDGRPLLVAELGVAGVLAGLPHHLVAEGAGGGGGLIGLIGVGHGGLSVMSGAGAPEVCGYVHIP